MMGAVNSTSVLNQDRPVKLLVLGGGYSGRRLAARAAQLGLAGVISHRDPAAAPPPPAGWRQVGFDSDSGLRPDPAALMDITHLVSTIAPDREGRDPVLSQLDDLLGSLRPQWLGYLSTTGVYGDSGGAWVDEHSACQPRPGRSANRLDCEQAWLATGLPVQIFRLPGIYGPGRSPFATLRNGSSRLLHRPGQVFCRIHVDDICGALLHCLALPEQQRPPVINISDDWPCPASEVLGYAAHLTGCKLPPLQRYEAAASTLSPMARSFWSESRRVRNDLLTRQLGYRLRYPTYREGLRASLAEEAGTAAPPGAQPGAGASGSAT
jgi:nucleoside-diphosphate-sugar epimerase